MEKTFEEKVSVVGSAFFNRYEEGEASEILQKIFENHDMTGPICLALLSGDIEIKKQEMREMIESTYEVIDSVFDWADKEESPE